MDYKKSTKKQAESQKWLSGAGDEFPFLPVQGGPIGHLTARIL
jgi:hypothetical protein